eukprot:CAMPEP_0177609756 /NCGR_PEP_ID=MMETSP0419_2-20121207/19309_1 /TAXON_ID=582737 /ORGANISM="Tetraselmis sp., Strain GSL018" /LENGTH=86 /DNA_ID=CAMNT_0019104803 /DNA_START=508 /DNA_END=768 /DNA_ORIENTATION=+
MEGQQHPEEPCACVDVPGRVPVAVVHVDQGAVVELWLHEVVDRFVQGVAQGHQLAAAALRGVTLGPHCELCVRHAHLLFAFVEATV